MSRAKKEAEKVLRAIEFEPAPLSTNKGPVIPDNSPISKKDRRHSGRYYGRITKPQMKFSEIHQNAIDDKEHYDRWTEYKDGYRDWRNMHKNIYYTISFYSDELYYHLLRNNYLIRKYRKIREARKIKERLKSLSP